MSMALDADVVTEILRRVDGKTLAKASCASWELLAIANQESLWEDAFSSFFSSTQNPQLQLLISSSLGGFKQFYANCFSFIVPPHLPIHTDFSVNYHDENSCDILISSDLMWLIHVQYDDKPVFSKIAWEVPYARNFAEWYLQSPFQTDIVNLEDELPTIMSLDELGKESEIWRQLTEKIKLSWIIINKRTGQAANLSSWSPLVGQSQPSSGVKYVVRFGSLLPAVDILPCNVVNCIVEMKCRVSATTLKMTEVSVRLEDMSGNDFNGEKGLEILEKALRYRRSNDRNMILELQRKYMSAGSNFKEDAGITTKESPKTVWIMTSIVALVSFYCLTSLLGILFK